MASFCTLKNVVWKPDDKEILNIKELKINEGDKIALIGANGAGKTSLLKVLSFLEKNIKGQVEYPGLSAKTELEKRRLISFVFQTSNLLKGSVFDNISLGLKLRHMPSAEIKEKVNYWLDQFHISHLTKRNARTLSKGEAQRVSLARALITDPKFLLLDEPFSNLDVPTRAEILMDLADIIKDSGITLIMITHYPAEIPIIAERVLVIDSGEIIEDGPPVEVLENPRNAVTAKLVGIDNVYEANITGSQAEIDGIGTLSLDSTLSLSKPAETRTTDIFIKPDLIRFFSGQGFNNFDFEIGKVVPMHDSYNLHGKSMPLLIRLSRRQYMKNQLQAGQTIRIHIPPEAIVIGER